MKNDSWRQTTPAAERAEPVAASPPDLTLFDVDAECGPAVRIHKVKVSRFPVWTHMKAWLIEEYMRLFLYVTKHGTFIDAMAAPQQEDRPEMWVAKRIVEMTPSWLRHFHLCDIDPKRIHHVRQLRADHPDKDISVYLGDFNDRIHEILAAGAFKKNEPMFVLIDQHTFECAWTTLETIAAYKEGGYKVEIFYFLAQSWLDRALMASTSPEGRATVTSWWGQDDWERLIRMPGWERAELFVERFRSELGYVYVTSYPILDDDGRIMFFMIHATDHPEATDLMGRAYTKARPLPDFTQGRLC